VRSSGIILRWRPSSYASSSRTPPTRKATGTDFPFWVPQRMKGKRRKRPRWGLAQLMRPAKAASDVSFVCLPLCYPPNAIVQRSTRLLDPVVPCKPPCQPGCIKKSAPTRSNVKHANNAFLQIEPRKIRGCFSRCHRYICDMRSRDLGIDRANRRPPAQQRFPVTMEPPAPCRVITRTPAREIGNPSSARAPIRETRIVRPGLFVFAPHKKSAAADAKRRPTGGTTRPRNQLPLSEFDCLQGRLDAALRHSRLYLLRPSVSLEGLFLPPTRKQLEPTSPF
jgi:hypothetical protein